MNAPIMGIPGKSVGVIDSGQAAQGAGGGAGGDGAAHVPVRGGGRRGGQGTPKQTKLYINNLDSLLFSNKIACLYED